MAFSSWNINDCNSQWYCIYDCDTNVHVAMMNEPSHKSEFKLCALV